MYTYVLEREQLIPRPRREVFAFFCDAFNLEHITPPHLRFRILTPPPIKMGAGTILDYGLSFYGLPFKWRTLIEKWQREEEFVDTQLCGPYVLWQHTHTFEEIAPRQTLMRDRVLYRLPFGIFGRLAHRLFVGRALRVIFDYRWETTTKLLLAETGTAPAEGSLVRAASAGDKR